MTLNVRDQVNLTLEEQQLLEVIFGRNALVESERRIAREHFGQVIDPETRKFLKRVTDG